MHVIKYKILYLQYKLLFRLNYTSVKFALKYPSFNSVIIGKWIENAYAVGGIYFIKVENTPHLSVININKNSLFRYIQLMNVCGLYYISHTSLIECI